VNKNDNDQAPAVIRRDGVHSEDVALQGASQSMREAVSAGGIVTEQVLRTDALDHERFMREELTIILAEGQSENDAPFIPVGVNGDLKRVYRGVEQKLPRMHVAVLANAKGSRVQQDKTTNNDGTIGYSERVITARTYPFQVVNDPSPVKGAAWLKSLHAQPA
jgi:hypothetical protein